MQLTKIQRSRLKSSLEELREELDRIERIEHVKLKYDYLHNFFTKPHTVCTVLTALDISDKVYDDFRKLSEDVLKKLREFE